MGQHSKSMVIGLKMREDFHKCTLLCILEGDLSLMICWARDVKQALPRRQPMDILSS